MASLRVFLIALTILSAGCAGSRTGRAPLYTGLGSHQRAVTTTSDRAQRYFDQGLVWAYAFNHDEAIRSFEQATREDPGCAMAWWGIALCHGPHINNPVVPHKREVAAWQALQQALALRDSIDERERGLIDALATRYASPPPSDRRPYDEAYANAMRRLYQRYPDDSDIATLTAEALMDLRPWDLWDDAGQPQPGTPEILQILESVLESDPENPGANHLYVHAIEASPQPQRAAVAADRLRTLVPVSGHLVHMPSHIDVLTGRWELAAHQNERAIKADRAYRRRSPRQGFYHIYMAHNHHMLSFASMMEGRRTAALDAARAVIDSVPRQFLKAQGPLLDPYMGAVYDAHKRFGNWEGLLREPAPPTYLPITTAMWHFNRGLALAALDRLPEAEIERAAFRTAVAGIPADTLMVINKAHDLLQIAEHMLNGEIAFRQGAIDDSIRELRRAVAIEDRLMYMEPPEWMQPVRHTLGAFLLSANRPAEAAAVYREDLEKWPDNGWSLYGLLRCAQAGAGGDPADYQARLSTAWRRADIPITTSCLCVPKI